MLTPAKLIKNPLAKKRYLRFMEARRARYSFLLLFTIYFISLFSEIICNDAPIYVRANDRSYFPALFFYPETALTGSGKQTRPDYKAISQTPLFAQNPKNFMVFPPFRFGPYESAKIKSLKRAGNVSVSAEPRPVMAAANIQKDYAVVRSRSLEYFIGQDEKRNKKDKKTIPGKPLTDRLPLPPEIKEAAARRFNNRESPSISRAVKTPGGKTVIISLSTFSPRENPPQTVRLTLRENIAESLPAGKMVFDPKLKLISQAGKIWDRMGQKARKKTLAHVRLRLRRHVEPVHLDIGGFRHRLSFEKKEARFPFPPTPGHPMGIDGSGRDVLARMLYGLRTSVTFGLLLVFFSISIGVAAGAFQGYYGGMVDMTAQRLIEIWSALPFLYVMILAGSVFGRGFFLLLLCYGVFNWIGISYYVRAEFLRLRRRPFVEAARSMGIPARKIIFRHILPNALTPVITFFPFSLVGAIGALTALDYLGFGLPPPTPSWGELLAQARQFRWAWWLILYPSAALFVVMLCAVFVGEGVRNAYDPKPYALLK
jgi:microcin C transport system permease protein